MAKTLVLGSLLALLLGNPERMAQITISPLPPVAGQDMTISTTGMSPGDTLEVDIDPTGVINVTLDADGKAVVKMPDNATSVIVSDPKGRAKSVSSMVGL
jgi:hypothetical protein